MTESDLPAEGANAPFLKLCKNPLCVTAYLETTFQECKNPNCDSGFFFELDLHRREWLSRGASTRASLGGNGCKDLKSLARQTYEKNFRSAKKTPARNAKIRGTARN